MKEAQNVQTLCLGRFLIDVPKGTSIVASSSNYRWDSVSVTRQVSREKFLHFITDKEKTLKETKHQEEPSLLKTISWGGDGNSAALVFWETPASQRLYLTEAYKWSNGVQFLIKGESNRSKVPAALEMANRSLAELRFRRDGEIPSVPGFCIESGFFAGEPAMPHLERAFLHLRLKDHPDVRIEIYTRTNGEKSEESLLARMGRKEIPDFLKNLDAKKQSSEARPTSSWQCFGRGAFGVDTCRRHFFDPYVFLGERRQAARPLCTDDSTEAGKRQCC